MKVFAVVAASVVALLSAPVAAQRVQPNACALTIQSSTANWFIQGYDPLATAPPIGSYDVTFVNDGGSACAFDPVFMLDQDAFGLTPDNRQSRVAYTLLDIFSNTNATPVSGMTVNTATRRPVVVQPRSQQMVRYQFAVDETGLVADGLYSQRLTLSAVQRGSGDVLATKSLVVGVNVLPSAVIGLSGQFTRVGGQALIDLGELREGQAPVPLQLRVSSTRPYQIQFDSLNKGRLSLDGTRWQIPYSISVDQKSLSLASTAVYDSPHFGINADVLPLRFIVGNVAGVRAGTYSDTLTVTVAPR